ncbi:MAG TPA: M12 family metallo-peptidase, partial [Phycisphaerales bacterium]|nr:M12 family metallo-peptidase [Phycisphaerales bacterium]
LSSIIPHALVTQHIIYKQADILPGPWHCAENDALGRANLERLHIDPAAQGGIAGSTGTCLFSADIAIEVDNEYYQLDGSDPNQTMDDIETILNDVNFIYEQDCGITHSLVEVYIRTSEPDPYTATDPGALLDQFQNEWNANFTDLNRDIAHLFTGKEIDGNVIGIAYLPGVCTDTNAYGLSQSKFTDNLGYRVALTAHELGHNWGAPHCDAISDCTIMCSAVASCNPDISHFESSSQGFITAYRNSVHCLDVPDQVPFGNHQFVPADGLAGDRFGVSVCMYANSIIIGSYLNDAAGSNAGTAYIYTYTGSTWVLESRLTPDDIANSDFFGTSVSMYGDVAIVGSPGDDDNGRNSGSAFVFRRSGNTWHQEAKLLPDDGAGSDSFGYSVSICKSSKDVAIVGSYLDNDTGSDSGSAYIFRKFAGQWEQVQKLVPDDPQSQSRFGYSVSITTAAGTERAIIGEYLADIDDGKGGTINDAGAAYVFRRLGTSWIQDAKLTASDPAPNDQFGSSVSICNTGPQQGLIAIVGAWFADDALVDPVIPNCGAAYVFRRPFNSWQQQAKLMASDRAAEDRFGVAVGITSTDESQFAIVGAYLVDGGGHNNIGAAYNFHADRSTWIEDGSIHGPGADTNDQFGFAVSIYGDSSAVGAWADDIPGPDTTTITDIGTVDVYSSLVGTDCNMNGKPDACEIAAGTSLDENNNGIPDECEGTPCPADINSPPDGHVNIDDLTVIILNWGTHNEPADITNDGIVNIDDLTAVILAWGNCP